MILFQVYGIQGVGCGSLNIIAPHKLIESSTIRRHDLVGVDMALLEKVCH